MRWLFRIVFIVFTVVLLAIGAVFLIPAEHVGTLISQQVEKATGRTLTLQGTLRPTFWPKPGLKTGAVALSNAPWASDAPMLQADSIAVGLDYAALMSGQMRIRELVFQRPRILLERGADGQANWELAPPANLAGNGVAAQNGGQGGGAGAGTAGQGFALDLLAIHDGVLTVIDRGANQRTEIDALNAQLRMPSGGAPADLALSFLLNGQAAAADVTISQPRAFLSGAVAPVAARVTLAKSTARFEGRASTSPIALDGTITAQLEELNSLFAALGLQQPAIGSDPGPVAVSAALTLAPEGSTHLRNFDVQFTGGQVTGEVDLLPGPVPKMLARLSAGQLNLALFFPQDAAAGNGASGTSGGGGSSEGWSRSPIDIGPLALFEADVALSAAGLDFGGLQLGPTEARITLDDRRLVFDIARIAAFEGAITGNFVINGRGALSVGGDLRATDIGLQPLLAQLAGYQRLSAPGDLSVRFLASGASTDALMRSLSGEAQVALGAGVLSGVDLLRLWQRRDAGSDARTIFDSASASFRIENGVAKNNDFLVTAPRFGASGKGEIDLGNREIDMLLRPSTLPSDPDRPAFSVPLKIEGPWSGPRFSLDLDELAKQRLEKLRDERREELNDGIADRLGLSPGEGQDIEDAARDKLREELGRGLRNLLDR